MSSNDQFILRQFIEQKYSEDGGAASLDDYFNTFVTEQLFKDYDLSSDQLDECDVDGPNDGGIDSALLVIDQRPVFAGDALDKLRNEANVEVFLIQSKNQSGFKEEPLNKLNATLGDLLNLQYDWKSDALGHKKRYSDAVLEFFSRVRDVIHKNVLQLPVLTFRMSYVTLADSVHENVRGKARQLKETIGRMFGGATCELDLLGAADLLTRLRTRRSNRYSIPIADSVAIDENAMAVLVNLATFYSAILRAESGELRADLFEANVRDYQGSTYINQEIADTLKRRQHQDDFWWLNNGITMLSAKTDSRIGSVTVENPQIVNGMQTSSEIYKYFAGAPAAVEGESRHVLIKIITIPEESAALRDRIIRATNSQNKVSDITLRATDKVQRDIEDHFLSKNLYYDRRRNFYRNHGKPRKQIVTMQFLAQSISAVILGQPHVSRGRPSAITKNDEQYNQIFSERRGVAFYFACVDFMRFVDVQLGDTGSDMARSTRQNIRFFVAFASGQAIIDGRRSEEERARVLTERPFKAGEFESLVAAVREAFALESQSRGVTEEVIAKNADGTKLTVAAVMPIFQRYGRDTRTLGDFQRRS